MQFCQNKHNSQEHATSDVHFNGEKVKMKHFDNAEIFDMLEAKRKFGSIFIIVWFLTL